MAFQLRDWQNEALLKCKALSRSVVEACPGSGKSAFSGALAKHWLDSGECDHVLAVAPSVSIKRSIMRQWQDNFGLRVRGNLIRRSGDGLKVPVKFDATVITYHELRNEQCEDMLRLWKSQTWSFGVVFDEIHHAASNQTWGGRVRTIGHDLASRVCIMTGTPFRSDGQPIELMDYVLHDGEHVAEPDFRYVYRQAVNDDICRPVTCRWIEGEIFFVHESKGQYTRSIKNVLPHEMRAAMGQFFDPSGEIMKNLVSLVHSDLMRLRQNDAYKDAAALFVCRPAANNETADGQSDKHVREMAKLIERLTGQEVVVVTHDQDDGADRIESFKTGKSPYIVAVNMVSEGVDIPRLRKVAFCRYTDSEMLFRQIVGRVVRRTAPNDPVASEVYVPGFPKMVEFGQRLWDEASAGLKERIAVEAQPGVGIVGGDEPEFPKSPKLIAVDASGGAGAGQFDQTEVETNWIGAAERVINTHTSYRHWNQVHLGAALKAFSELNQFGEPSSTDDQRRSNLFDRLRRRVNVLARLAWNGEYGVAWSVEVFEKHNVQSMDDIRALWPYDRINNLIGALDSRIEAVVCKKGTSHAV